MYDSTPDPYCYPGTRVLRNIPNLRDPANVEQYELALTTQRMDEPFPNGRLSVSHYYSFHRHIFQDVYTWAGKPRTVRMSKGESTFCYPENIATEMRRIFDWLRRERYLREKDPSQLVLDAAHFLSELNAIHPFREGNGRAQLAFLAMVTGQAGHPLHLERIRRGPFLQAMISSFMGDERPLRRELKRLLRPGD